MRKIVDFNSFNSINEKKDPQAKIRNRGDVVFPAGSKYVNDDKDHFPINSKNQARNALARANILLGVGIFTASSMLSKVYGW